MVPSRARYDPEDTRIRDFFLLILASVIAGFSARAIARLWLSPGNSEYVYMFALMFTAQWGGFLVWDRRRLTRGNFLMSALITTTGLLVFWLFKSLVPGFGD